MQRLGMSERGVYRRVSEGKLRQAQRPVPGRKPLPVYNPDDVDTLAAQSIRGTQALNYGTPPIMPSVAESVAEKLGAIAEAIADSAQRQFPAVEPEPDPDNSGEWRNVANWPPPLFLTTEQAVRYSGLSTGYLNRLVNEGRLKRIEEGIQGYRYRRADLEAL